jgi:parallel beta-helix repeat protein
LKRLFSRLACLVAASALASACGDDNNGGNVVNVDPSMSESAISAAFSNAAADSTIQMAAGTYHFTNSLNLATKNNITVKGAGMTTTILDFSTQAAGADAVVQTIQSGQVKTIFQDFSIRDSIGDGLKITGATGLHVNGVGVSWPTRTAHGGYGIYPVQSKSVLVENCNVDGASDTGIYVGQSDGIVVRNNVLTHNVAGIEIENSFNADVHDNDSHDNTVGFLVFDLPNLPQVGGHNIRVYNNQFKDNNTPNFGDPSGTVARVPAGTGGAVMANGKVEVFGNTFSGNTTVGFAAISCFTGVDPSPTGECVGNPSYNPLAREIWVHNNTFTSNGTDPLAHNSMGHPSFDLAGLLAQGFPPNSGDPGWLDGHVADVLWDGIIVIGSGVNPYAICAQNNTDASFHFANLNLLAVFQGGVPLNEALINDQTEFNCMPQGFPLPAVPVPTF